MLKSCKAETNGVLIATQEYKLLTHTFIGYAVTFSGLCKVR